MISGHSDQHLHSPLPSHGAAMTVFLLWLLLLPPELSSLGRLLVSATAAALSASAGVLLRAVQQSSLTVACS